ncbi:collagen alpha-1(XXI) chain-like [Styela clava]
MACYRLLILGVICISFSSAEIEQNAQLTVSQLTQPNSTIQATFNIEPLAKVAQNTSTQVDVKTESFAAKKKLTKFQKNKLARRLAREKKRKEKAQKVSPSRVKKINQRKVLNLSDPRVAPTKKNSDCTTKKCGANKKKFIKKAKNKKALKRKHEDVTNEQPTEGNTELEIPANIIEVMRDTPLNRFSQQENERNVRRILQNSNCYNQPADIMFVIDTSYDMVSIDFEKILNFVRESLSNLPISSAETRVGIATFDVFINIMISFKKYSDKKPLMDAISRIASDNKTQDVQGEDYFDAAIEIFSEENGARQLFSGTQHIMVMITNDGSMMSERIANVLSQDGVEKYLIVIGEGIYTQEIQHLVSEPVKSHAYVTPNFDELQKINLDLTKQLCNEEICSNGNIIDGGITGFDLLGLMNIDENDKVTKSNGSYENATAYSVDHEVDLRINPVSLILPLGIPRYYSIIATMQMNEQASHNDWSLFEVPNTREEVMEAVKISGQNRSVEYITMNDNMETVSVVFADAQKLFGKGFHKLTLLVTPDGVMLYIDCEVVEIITFNSSLGRPLADGEISIAKMGTFDPEIQVNLQQLDLICDVDINMSERFSCDRIGLKVRLGYILAI